MKEPTKVSAKISAGGQPTEFVLPLQAGGTAAFAELRFFFE